MRVIWTPEAQAHLDGIYQYLKRDAPFYANGVVDKLTRRSQQLIDHPHSGRIVPTCNARTRYAARAPGWDGLPWPPLFGVPERGRESMALT